MRSLRMLSPQIRCFLFALLGCLACLVTGADSFAAPRSGVQVDTDPGMQVQVEVNRMIKLRAGEPVMRAMVINEKIAEIYISDTQSPNWVFVAGKSIGTTQLTLWGNNNRMLGTFEITVRPDVSSLKKQLHDIFPQENIQVNSSGGSITLSGTVSGAAKLDKVLTVANAYAPEKIVNLLQVGGVQQVMLEVRVAEITKKVGHELGVNFYVDGSKGFGINMLGSLLTIDQDSKLTYSTAVNALFKINDGNTTYIGAIDALQEDGLAKILAKPTLIAQSGQSASFLAGGEFPFPVVNDNDTAIEWKPFGVALNFTPTVLGDNRISLQVTPEVSDLDYSRTVSYGSYVLPAINTRRMSTMIELGDNQSFAIGGLLKNNVRESIAKFPVLGDIPVLGALFRSTSFQKDDTELVVVVTPHLVKPIDGEQIPLPTDSFISPTAFELLMLGKMEAGNKKGTATAGGAPSSLEGNFGHIIPE